MLLNNQYHVLRIFWYIFGFESTSVCKLRRMCFRKSQGRFLYIIMFGLFL